MGISFIVQVIEEKRTLHRINGILYGGGCHARREQELNEQQRERDEPLDVPHILYSSQRTRE